MTPAKMKIEHVRRTSSSAQRGGERHEGLLELALGRSIHSETKKVRPEAASSAGTGLLYAPYVILSQLLSSKARERSCSVPELVLEQDGRNDSIAERADSCQPLQRRAQEWHFGAELSHAAVRASVRCTMSTLVVPVTSTQPFRMVATASQDGASGSSGATFCGVPLPLLSLVTLTVQNSLLTIVLHYSRVRVPADEMYSAASAVLLNEILKAGISLSVAYTNALRALPPAGYESVQPHQSSGGSRFAQAARNVARDVFRSAQLSLLLQLSADGLSQL